MPHHRRIPRHAAYALLLALLAGHSQALTRQEMAYREKLEAQPLLMATYGRIQAPGEKYEYLLTAWKKGEHWGVISEERRQKTNDTPDAYWLAKPVYADVLVPNFTRAQGHVWAKPVGETQWQAFSTNGKKLKALGSTPYSDMRVLRDGKDNRAGNYRPPSEDIRPRYRELIMGIHAGGNPASATADLIDAGENRVLLTLTHLDLRNDPLLENRALIFQHDAEAKGYTLVRLPAPPAPTDAHAPLEVSAFYRELTLDAPVVSALDVDGNAILLDRDLRPFTVPGLALGQPMPPAPHLAKADIFFKVPVLTDDGRAGYQFIFRGKDGNPALAPTLWQDIQLLRTYLIARDMQGQWHLLRWKAREAGYDFTPAQLAGKPVITDTLEAMDLAITEVHRLDMQQLAATNRAMTAQLARWEAERAAQARKEAADRITLQRQIDENAKARIAAEAEYQRLKEKSAAEFTARNKSSWGNLSPITLPSLRGAPGLSAMEKDYYDNRGNSRNPYVLREQRRP